MNTVTKLRNIVRNIAPISQQSQSNRFHISCVSRLKEIHVEEKDGVTTIKGVFVKSPREDVLLKWPNSQPNTESCKDCAICRLGPSIHIRHTDVLILHQFVDSFGRKLDRKITGLCAYQDRRMNYLIVMCRHAGLLPKRLPDGTIDPFESEGWKANNKYYNESAMDDFFSTDRRKI